MKSDYESRFREVVEEVGSKSFHTIYKIMSDGLPPDDEPGNELWRSSIVSKLLDEADTKKIAVLALAIEQEAYKSILRLFVSPGFVEYLKNDLVAANAKSLVKDRKRRTTDVFEACLKDNPSKSAKQVTRELEREGLIVQEGEYYLTVQNDLPHSKWPKFLASGMDAKLSKIRRRLKHSSNSEHALTRPVFPKN